MNKQKNPPSPITTTKIHNRTLKFDSSEMSALTVNMFRKKVLRSSLNTLLKALSFP